MLLHAFPSMFVSSLREFPENCVLQTRRTKLFYWIFAHNQRPWCDIAWLHVTNHVYKAIYASGTYSSSTNIYSPKKEKQHVKKYNLLHIFNIILNAEISITLLWNLAHWLFRPSSYFKIHCVQMTSLQNQYLLCPPLAYNTARTRLGIDSINRRIQSCGILPHSYSRACCSSCRVCGAGWRRSKSSTNVLLGWNLVI